MDMDDLLIIVVLFIGFGAGCASGHTAGKNEGIEKVQNEAISAGVAKWTIDQFTGEKEFVYINNELRSD